MRIAVLTSSYPRFKGDGTAPFVRSISEALVQRGHMVYVVAPYDVAVKDNLQSPVKVTRFKYVWPKKFHIMGHARSLKADVKLRPAALLLQPLFTLTSIIKLTRICRKIDAQIIHAHWVLPNGFAAAIVSKILHIPFIISLHGSDIFVADKNFLFRAIAKWTFSQCSYVTACSQELHDRAKKINPSIHIEIIPWGADPDVFKPLKDKNTVRDKYHWPKDEIIISTLGRIVYKKGFDQLLPIAKALSEGKTPFKIVIGGSGPLEDSLKQKAVDLNVQNIVLFPGRIPWDEVPEFLAASDIFVLPSRRDEAGNLDGLPTVLLEAMACGLPCVASDIGGVSLVIANDINGEMLPPSDIYATQKALSDLLNNVEMREQLGTRARNSVITTFNWKNVSRQIEDMLNKVTLF